jgi:hypothetical protein
MFFRENLNESVVFLHSDAAARVSLKSAFLAASLLPSGVVSVNWWKKGVVEKGRSSGVEPLRDLFLHVSHLVPAIDVP